MRVAILTPAAVALVACTAFDRFAPICGADVARDLGSAGQFLGPTFVAFGDTTGALSAIQPPASCAASMASAPEQVWRYVVRQGPRIYATTVGPACATTFDTVLSVAGCDANSPRACNNDDGVLAACPAGSAGAPAGGSSLLLDGLAPGAAIFFVVDGAQGGTGTYRLAITENGAPEVPPPPSVGSVDRCTCPAIVDFATLISVPFPAAGDTVDADGIAGDRTTALMTVAGIAFEARLAQNTLGGPGCDDARAIFDLALNDTVAHSFAIDAHTPVGVPVRAPFHTFASVPGQTIRVRLALRGVEPSGCGDVTFDPTYEGTLTLAGRPAP